MGGTWRDNNNFYEILEVSPNASLREIHEAFKRVKATYSNDNPALYSMFTREEARELLKMIEEAFEVLGNQQSREAYDSHLKGADNHVEAGVFTQIESASPQFTVPEAQAVPYSASDASRWQIQPSAFPDEGSGKIRVKTKPALESGLGQTKYGTYQIDKDFENQITSCGTFDGPFLKKIRLYKNLTLDHLSASTRISRPYLAAVEDMNVPALPAPVFVRGFVSHLARVLGIDEKRAADSYMKILKDKMPEEK
jgi:curved DNA-binding protein CbpA